MPTTPPPRRQPPCGMVANGRTYPLFRSPLRKPTLPRAHPTLTSRAPTLPEAPFYVLQNWATVWHWSRTCTPQTLRARLVPVLSPSPTRSIYRPYGAGQGAGLAPGSAWRVVRLEGCDTCLFIAIIPAQRISKQKGARVCLWDASRALNVLHRHAPVACRARAAAKWMRACMGTDGACLLSLSFCVGSADYLQLIEIARGLSLTPCPSTGHTRPDRLFHRGWPPIRQRCVQGCLCGLRGDAEVC